MKLRALEEIGLAHILKRRMTRHGEVRAVDLEEEAGCHYRLIFLAHGLGDRLDIGLVRGVVLVSLESWRPRQEKRR